jgi:hypothetical protein
MFAAPPHAIALFGLDIFGAPLRPRTAGPLNEKFTFPPFTVLDARAGEWRKRKAAWLALGIESETGRGQNLIFGVNSPARAFKCYQGRDCGPYAEGGALPALEQGSSVFDPVLCELAYRWFCPAGGQVLDPFAGGSVRGIVAGTLGLPYWGCDLRPEQITANRDQADRINLPVAPVWVCGDSAALLPGAPAADFIFTCPPYGDLERYSDDPRDLSAMEWTEFLAAYRKIVGQACSALRSDRFACLVVGDFRDPRGYYRNFVAETTRAFADAGARLYNEAALLTAIGTATIRAPRIFAAGRKLCKCHQNVLVFCKGDWRAAAAACNPDF